MGADGAQDDPVTGSRSLVSRRNVLRAAGAAGAAVWVAPVVESFTSYAVAGSAPTTATGQNFGCSWVYVVWEQAGTVYYTGWKGDNSTVCNSDGAYPLSKPKVSNPCNGTTYTLEPTSGAPPEISYSGGTIGHGTLTSTVDGCSNFSYTYSGSSGHTTIHATGSTTILAAFSFGGSVAYGLCPNGTGANNSLLVTCS